MLIPKLYSITQIYKTLKTRLNLNKIAQPKRVQLTVILQYKKNC